MRRTGPRRGKEREREKRWDQREQTVTNWRIELVTTGVPPRQIERERVLLS